MKCPACGQWNRDYYPVCQKCGAELLKETTNQEPSWRGTLKDDKKPNQYIRADDEGEEMDTDPDSRDVLAKEMNDLKVRKASGNEYQRQLRQATVVRNETSGTIRTSLTSKPQWDLHEPEERPALPVSMVGKPAQKRDAGEKHGTRKIRRIEYTAARNDAVSEADANVRRFDPMSEEQEFSGTWSLPPIQPTSTITIKLPRQKRGSGFLIRFLTVFLILSLLGSTGYFGYHYYQDHEAKKAEENAPIITASMLDDMAAHTILIPGEDGQQIYIQEMHTSYIVSNGFATVEIADHTWYDDYEDYLSETMSVTLTPFVKTASGKQNKLNPITYDIQIPLSPMELLTPDGFRKEVSTAMYTMKLKVRPGSNLTINGVDYSDTVDRETGAVSFNATVQPIGDNNFTFVVRSQYCRENIMTVTLYREVQEIPLDLAADTYGTTNSQRMKVSATTLPGATVEVLSSYSDLDITNIDSTGAFTFYALFDKIGDNTISISSSYPGKKTSYVNYTVYYLPSPDIYTTKAWKLDESGYSELVGNIQVRAEKTQVYLVTGTVQYLVSEKPQMAVIYTSADGQSQPVLVENNTNKDLKVGQYYRIYADVSGTYNSMPWLQGRYVYLN